MNIFYLLFFLRQNFKGKSIERKMQFEKKEKIQQFINFLKAIDYKVELAISFKDKAVD